LMTPRIRPYNKKVLGYLDFHDPRTAVTSYFLRPKALGIVRLVLASYAINVWIWGILYDSFYTNSHRWHWYLTNLSYTGLTAYMTSAAIHTLIYAFKTKPAAKANGVEYPAPTTLRRGAVHTRLHFLVYTSFVCLHIGVPFVYWAFLHPWKRAWDWPLRDWINVSSHGSDFIVLVVELIVGRILLRWTDWFLLLILSALYMSYAIFLYLVTGDWVYSVLDWSRGPSVLVFYIGIPILFSGCFVLAMGLQRVREHMGRRSTNSHFVANDDKPKETV